MSRTVLAAVSGVPARTIEAYERGESLPGIEAAHRLAVALNVTIDDLVREAFA